MILLLAIILFIIFLIYSIKPRGEGYTLEGLKLSWANKASIEGVVTKWIVTLKDSSGSVIHTYENSDAGNLKDFTDVNMNIVNNKEFDEKIIGDNILELYYNEIKDSNKLYTKTVTFTQNDFGYIIDTSKLEKIDIPEPEAMDYTYAKSIWFGYENSSWNNRPLNIAEIEVYSGGVNVATKATKTESSSQYTANYYKPKNLIDGNMSNFAHTHGGGTNWFKITLDKQYPIEKVMVYNRTSCCFARWASSFVKLLDDNGNEIMRSIEKIPDDTGLATNYKEGGVRVKTFTFGNTVMTSSYSEPMNLSGGFKWYYYEGSYFSVPSSFDNKKPSNEGTGVTDFSNINKATNGVLQVNGRDNYAVRWQGRFVPKKDGSHKFWSKSDDMSYLYVNNDKVVDSGGLHGMNKSGSYDPDKYGTVIMEKGREYLIEIFFSEKGGGDNIIVNFQEPNGTKTTNFSGYMVKDTNSYLYYGGDSNLGRDGRNACNMTDDDRKYACDNDSELVGIGSGNTCGHKFYKTDQGTGSTISSTDEYTKFYSCEIERRRFGGP